MVKVQRRRHRTRRRLTASKRRRAAPCRDPLIPSRAALNLQAACLRRAASPHPRSTRKRVQANNSRNNASSNSSVSNVTVGDGSPRAGASRGAADGPSDHRVRPNVAVTTSDARARGRRNRARIIARGPRVPPAITDRAGSVARSRATANAQGHGRAAIDDPDRHLPIGNGLRDRAPADGNLARIPERGGGTAGRVASHRGQRNAEDHVRDPTAARETVDDRGPTFLEEANGGAVGPGRGIEVENHDLSRAIAMVRSRHIDTGIEVRTCS